MRFVQLALLLPVLIGVAGAPARAAPPGQASTPDQATSPADPGGCSGTLSGAVTATFACTVTARIDGTLATVTIAADGPVAGLRAFQPATVSLPVPIPSGTYGGEALRSATSSLETGDGRRFAAGPGKGEVTLLVDQAERYRQSPNHLVMAGSLKARLVPAQPGKGGDVVLEVRF